MDRTTDLILCSLLIAVGFCSGPGGSGKFCVSCNCNLLSDRGFKCRLLNLCLESSERCPVTNTFSET